MLHVDSLYCTWKYFLWFFFLDGDRIDSWLRIGNKKVKLVLQKMDYTNSHYVPPDWIKAEKTSSFFFFCTKIIINYFFRRSWNFLWGFESSNVVAREREKKIFFLINMSIINAVRQKVLLVMPGWQFTIDLEKKKQ